MPTPLINLHGLLDTFIYRMRICLPKGSALPVERRGKKRKGGGGTPDLPDLSSLWRHLPESADSQQQKHGDRNSPSSAGDTDGYPSLKKQQRSLSFLD